MPKQRRYLVELFTAVGLIVAPFILPHLGFAPNTVNRILVWGLFGIGFDILFGYTGLLSFGQSAFYGTGGFVAAYLLLKPEVLDNARHDGPGLQAGAGIVEEDRVLAAGGVGSEVVDVPMALHASLPSHFA